MDKPITEWQRVSLKNKFIWLNSSAAYKPSEYFMNWWNKQNIKDMEKKLEKLQFGQAAALNYQVVMGNWTNAIELWQRFTD